MQPSEITVKNIIHGIAGLPPDALREVEDFVQFLRYKSAKNALSKPAQTMSNAQTLKEELLAIGRQCAALPLLDKRTADEILGYTPPSCPQ